MSKNDVHTDSSPFASSARNMNGVLMNSRANKGKKIVKSFGEGTADRFTVAELLYAGYSDLEGIREYFISAITV